MEGSTRGEIELTRGEIEMNLGNGGWGGGLKQTLEKWETQKGDGGGRY